MNEEDIFPTFDSFGPLMDVAVIRDKHTGIHRGCAFITYWSAADAESAREALHDKFTFPGAKRAAQVKPAEPSAMMNAASMGYYGNYDHPNSQDSHSSSIPNVAEHKLFIGMLSIACEEQELRNLFSQFGEIREVFMIRNADGSSKCAAFLRFEDRESAVQAIKQLNGVEIMNGVGRPLIVKFADNRQERQRRHFRNVQRHEMMAMVGSGAYPYHPQDPQIAMGMHPSAGPQYPMPPTASLHVYGPVDYGHNAQVPAHHHFMYQPRYSQVLPYPYQQPLHRPEPSRPAAALNPLRPREGPAGANLFVYHLPHDLTDADLATAFNPFGNVISAKVYVDKFTGESKGFGTLCRHTCVYCMILVS
jgi:CUG-BP- and ETR3-like factor